MNLQQARLRKAKAPQMLQTKLFLIECGRGDTDAVAVLRDISQLIDRAKAAVAAGRTVMVHVGTARPSDESVRAALRDQDGVVLLTEAALWALPEAVTGDARAVASIALGGRATKMPLHIAMSGWGYVHTAVEAVDHPVATPVNQPQSKGIQSSQSWMHAPSAAQVPQIADMIACGRSEDKEFWRLLESVSDEERVLLREIRRREIRQLHCHSSAQAIARGAPQWFRETSTQQLRLKVRTANVLRDECVGAVAHLDEWPDSRLLSLRNFGRVSLRDLESRLLAVLLEGPPPDPGAPGSVTDVYALPASHVILCRTPCAGSRSNRFAWERERLVSCGGSDWLILVSCWSAIRTRFWASAPLE